MTHPDKKADFSDVQSDVQSTEQLTQKADFSDVQSSVSSTEKITTVNAAPMGEQTHTVVSGDNLSKIAKHYYGHANQWQAIFAANRDQLSDPDKIFPGQVLKIPAHNG